jgi:hypothetical protein
MQKFNIENETIKYAQELDHYDGALSIGTKILV